MTRGSEKRVDWHSRCWHPLCGLGDAHNRGGVTIRCLEDTEGIVDPMGQLVVACRVVALDVPTPITISTIIYTKGTYPVLVYMLLSILVFYILSDHHKVLKNRFI